VRQKPHARDGTERTAIPNAFPAVIAPSVVKPSYGIRRLGLIESLGDGKKAQVLISVLLSDNASVDKFENENAEFLRPTNAK
jgi:hypothetical protein